ncbi:unnamed protein product [Sphenostylis stenocarpa]|uniref:Uncharacterized protein n=1 Tax=Sphenostylis stenocarpa TaxID=92480 RepID=A0AA86SMC9_9FABA|nr:unnamed protein product [Sphenostylis stenocarpa]
MEEESLTVEGKMSVGATCMRVSLRGPTGLDVVGILEDWGIERGHTISYLAMVAYIGKPLGVMLVLSKTYLLLKAIE